MVCRRRGGPAGATAPSRRAVPEANWPFRRTRSGVARFRRRRAAGPATASSGRTGPTSRPALQPPGTLPQARCHCPRSRSRSHRVPRRRPALQLLATARLRFLAGFLAGLGRPAIWFGRRSACAASPRPAPLFFLFFVRKRSEVPKPKAFAGVAWACASQLPARCGPTCRQWRASLFQSRG